MENNTTTPPQSENKPPKVKRAGSNEPLFGMLLFVLMTIMVLGFLAGIAWMGYSGWQANKEKGEQPSISTLVEEQKKAEPTQEQTPTPTPQPTPAPAETPSTTVTPETLNKAKNTDIKVMNGGAAKGSAGVLMEALKKEGYLKVTAGNTLSDYTGAVIYYATGLDKEAEAVKQSVIKTYPKVTTKPAEVANKETSAAVITVILGK